MFQILEAGKTLVIDLPWLRKNPEEFFKLKEIRPQTLSYRIFLSEKEIVRGNLWPDCRLEADLSKNHSGAYAVHIYGMDEEGEETEVWKQFVYVQMNMKRTPEEIHDIASRFAPVFLFSRKEKYFPVSFSELLHAQAIEKTSQCVKVETIFGEEEIPLKHLDEFLRYNGNCDYLLDQSILDMSESVFHEIKGDFRRSVVYYSYIEDSSRNRFFINYHTFYAFDPKTGIAKMLNIGPHIFDRESLTISFRSDGTPESLVLSGHLENQPILFLEKLKMWKTGRVKIAIPDTLSPAVGNHAIVPVAEGSHALYPTAGLYHISVLTELAGHVFRSILPMDTDDDEPPEMETHQLLLPPEMKSDRFVNYDLRPLRLDLLRSESHAAQTLYDPSTACLVFSGYWVDVPGLQNERFPPFSRKEKDIEEWIDQAYPWEWKDLPENILRHNRALSEYVESNILRY